MPLAENRVFKRQLRKLSATTQSKVRERLNMLITDEFNPLLNNHKLGPPFEEYRSINISGDIRLVYKKIAEDIYYLRAIGTHHQLYGT